MKLNQRPIPYDITYMWNLKYDTNEVTYLQKRNRLRTGLREWKWGRDGLEVWDQKLQTVIVNGYTTSYHTAQGTIFNIL